MKKLSGLIILSVLFFTNTYAQFPSLYTMHQNEGLLGGGFGVTWIDGAPYYSFHVFPEFAFSNFGVGLDLKLEYGADGKIRTENFNEFSDYLSIIRYVRYGYKGDPLYARLGALDYATLGHGSIMYLYNNRPSYDTRKVGLAFDVDFTTFGIETVYGSFGEAGIVGLRVYTRPFQFTALSDVPIIKNIEVGASAVSDLNKKAGVLAGNYDTVTEKFTATKDEGPVTIIGADIGIPIINSSMLKWELYIDYNKILDFGSGGAAGFVLGFNGLGLVNVRTKFERRINGDQYLPSYFNALYEIERFKLDEETGTVNSKVQRLKNAGPAGNGWYGELLVTVLGSFDILGSYQRLDKDPDSGILHLETDVMPEGLPYVLRGGYDKTHIKNEGDIFKLDDRSYLYAEFGYKPLPYLVVSMVYNWTFTPVRDADNNVIDYKPQKKIEPRISFYYPISL